MKENNKNAKSIYGLKFPVKIAVKKEEEPLHWHKDLEILCILKGKVNLQVNNAFYELGEDDIFLINSEDLHSISMVQEKSIFLSLNINLIYYEKFFMEMEYIVFIDDDSINSPENLDLQLNVKWRIAQMLIEIKNKNVDYQNRIIYHASSLLAILIDNYNMVKKNVKYKNKEQLSRIWKAYEYMYNNYNRRIGLEEVSNYVSVSNSYLSHIIKGTMGISFEKLLNQIRAEHSLKFLLTSNKSITKISEECGFSDPKYYKNFFMQFFHCTPLEYRNRNQHNVAEGDFEAMSYFETIIYNDLLNNKITKYLDDPVKEADDTVIDLTIDFINRREIKVLDKSWKREIILPAEDSRETFMNMEKLKSLQTEIAFDYIYMKDVLQSGFMVNGSDTTVTIDWNALDRLIEKIRELNSYPKLGFHKAKLEVEPFLSLIQKFLFHYKLKYSDAEIRHWILFFTISEEAEEKNLKALIEELVSSVTSQLKLEFVTSNSEAAENEATYDDESGISFIKKILVDQKHIRNNFNLLMDHRGLKSNLYFAYLFLNKLEGQVMNYGENYIITKGHNRLVILAFNCKESNRNKLEIAFNLLNLKGKRYVLKQYSLYCQQEKAETYIKNVQDTDFMSDDDIKSINRGRYPDLCIEFFEHFESIHRSLTLIPNRAELISIERVL